MVNFQVMTFNTPEQYSLVEIYLDSFESFYAYNLGGGSYPNFEPYFKKFSRQNRVETFRGVTELTPIENMNKFISIHVPLMNSKYARYLELFIIYNGFEHMNNKMTANNLVVWVENTFSDKLLESFIFRRTIGAKIGNMRINDIGEYNRDHDLITTTNFEELELLKLRLFTNGFYSMALTETFSPLDVVKWYLVDREKTGILVDDFIYTMSRFLLEKYPKEQQKVIDLQLNSKAFLTDSFFRI